MEQFLMLGILLFHHYLKLLLNFYHLYQHFLFLDLYGLFLNKFLEESVCSDQYVLFTKLCQPSPCFILYSKAKLACYSRCILTSCFCIPVPNDEKNIIFGVSSRRSCRSSWNQSTSASLALVVGAQIQITVEWLLLNRLLMLNGLRWKQTKIILSFLRLHPVLHFRVFC